MPDGPVVAIIVLAVSGLLAVVYFVYDYQRHRRGAGHGHARAVERLPLFGTDLLATRGADGVLHVDDAPGPAAVAAPARRPVSAPPPPAPDQAASHASSQAASFAPPAVTAPAPRANGNGVAAPLPAAPPRAHPPAPPLAPPLAPPAVGRDGAEAAFANGETLRFALPDEGTLRFLPGRLEVVAGPDAGREIRFVAPPGAGGDDAEVTFGRTEGPPYRHVQLMARTVSRRHAVMSLSEGHWSLQNLSATNPVVLNGRALAADEVAPLLVEGDRIEMGEVVFTFHGR